MEAQAVPARTNGNANVRANLMDDLLHLGVLPTDDGTLHGTVPARVEAPRARRRVGGRDAGPLAVQLTTRCRRRRPSGRPATARAVGSARCFRSIPRRARVG